MRLFRATLEFYRSMRDIYNFKYSYTESYKDFNERMIESKRIIKELGATTSKN